MTTDSSDGTDRGNGGEGFFFKRNLNSGLQARSSLLSLPFQQVFLGFLPSVLSVLSVVKTPLPLRGFIALPAVLALAVFPLRGQESAEYGNTIRPLLQEHCLNCHSTEKHKGDLDLERLAAPAEVRKHPEIWQGLIEQVGTGEMPPKEEKPLAAADRERLLTWANSLLDSIALEHAGDPGPVVLRRLSNAEYTYTLRDLTALDSLDPAREFPADSAAGEGFMNVGNALVMSPSLLVKYLDAAKEVTRHAVLVPDGIRFSSGVTRRDWTEELLGQIREFYARYTVNGGGSAVNLQGIRFDTRDGGVLPLDQYLAATLEARNAPSGIPELASRRGLNPRYLAGLYGMLSDSTPSFLLDPLRTHWRAAGAGDTNAVASLVSEVQSWQRAVWRFNSIGHIGKAGGPKAWMEPVNPVVARQEFRLKLAAPTNGQDIVVYWVAGDAGDGADHDFVLWQQPRIEAPGRPPLPLRDLRGVARELAMRRERIFASTRAALAGAAEAAAATESADIAALAQRHAVDTESLDAWLGYLGIGPAIPPRLDLLTNTLRSVAGHDFVNGWGSGETPSVMASSSGESVRIPGNMKAHGVVMHPSPTLNTAVGWRSPIAGPVRITAQVTHAHPECGNGVTWALELRRGSTRQRLAAGTAQGGKPVAMPPIENLALRRGDLVSLLVGPRDSNHSCDLTDVELVIRSTAIDGPEWNLTREVSPDILAANPRPDRLGHPDVWHFYTEAVSGQDARSPIPAGSLLARWQVAESAAERQELATALQTLLLAGPPPASSGPDAALYRELSALGGPLLFRGKTPSEGNARPVSATANTGPDWGLDPARFGRHPSGGTVDPDSLCVLAPSVVEIHLPADLVAGAELVVTAVPDPLHGAGGITQPEVTLTRPAERVMLRPGTSAVAATQGPWTGPPGAVVNSAPLLAADGSPARQRLDQGLDDFRQWFPAALCYTKIVPVDEVVTLTLYHREDAPLIRLMLTDAERMELERLWSELRFVSQDALALVDAFEQLWQYATQDADPKVFEPMRQPILDRAKAFRTELVEAEPRQLDAVLEFAGRSFRRPLTASEGAELRALYAELRSKELPHDESLRLTLARVWVSPAFLYRMETAPAGTQAGPVTDWELATRLSYFLWSSLPDAELRAAADAGRLKDPNVLAAQSRRMMKDPRVRRMAVEFACAWLHIHGFDELDEKSERHFPTFAALRGPMYEEAIRYFTDAIQSDAPVTTWFASDHTFLNAALAQHYGIPNVTGDAWRRVSGVSVYGRGGLLGMGATLSKQSGASRTSPILRGNWVSEVLLGDKLPRPPKDVPRLPEDESTDTLTMRQLTEKHSSDPRCSGCHLRIDGFGFALEGFDAIGRARTQDLGGRPVETHSRLLDGTEVDGARGLQQYLLTKKRDVVLRQFNRKLLGYALGRSVILSDKPLLKDMQQQLAANGDRLGVAVETIVRSSQFREIRGREMQ
ncbi:MAG: hypothetical protein RIS76_1854 [Verrucomicrobiota bacterium]